MRLATKSWEDLNVNGKIFFAFFYLSISLFPSIGWSQKEKRDAKEVQEILVTLDERQRNMGDYQWEGVIYQQERGKSDTAYRAVVYRRDEEDKLMILFTAPKTEAGKGYLRIDDSLFRYDPTIGRWERTTERERILGTNTRRADFDESRLAEEFLGTHVGDEKLGERRVIHLRLQAKPNVDVSYPIVEIWVDEKSFHPLKRQDFSSSRRLLRTLYMPTWNAYFSTDKNAEVFVPSEIRVFDELEKGTNTIITLENVELTPLPENIFTKAWLESKSR